LNPTNTTLQLMGRYVLTLARYDQDYDVRDRARLVASLLIGVVPNVFGDEEGDKEERGIVILRREQVKMVLFEHKAAVKEPSALEGVYSPTVAHRGAYIDQERVASLSQRPASSLADPWLRSGISPNGSSKGRNLP
jgi:hypothetical protein